MPQKVFVYAQTHDERGNDKVLVLKEPHKEVFTLPQGDVLDGRPPEWVACEVLEAQTGLNIYPDRRLPPGAFCFSDNDFIRFPHLEGKLLAGNMEVLCYSVEVNERNSIKENSMWMPWWTLRWDDRMSTMMRFVIALLYAGISGWEMRLDERGNWTLPYLCTEGRKNHTVDEILSGEIKVEVYDSFEAIIRKSIDSRVAKHSKPEPEVTPPMQENWVFRFFRRWGMLN